MTNVVPSLDSKDRGNRSKTLRSRRVRDEQGRLVVQYVLDANSPSFDDEFLKVFQLNARRARRETREAEKKLGIAAE